MAERRMFAKSIVLSDAFLDMPLSARCLYFTFGMFADDDGFVNSPKGIMRQCGASVDDFNVLLAKKFILLFENGVIVIKHWRINNYLRNDRFTPTKYVEEKDLLRIEENGSYTLNDDVVYPKAVYPDKYSIDKVSIDKDSKPPLSPFQGETENEKPKKKKPATKDKMLSMVDEKPYSDLLKAGLKDWIEYKVEKGQSYQEKGFSALLKRVDNELTNATDEAIVECISTSMENSYQGIVWDKLKRGGVTDRRNSIKASAETQSGEGVYDEFAREYFAKRGIKV